MDEVFGKDCFLNEIIWNYSGGRIGKNFFGRKHDNIYWYAKQYGNQTFNYDALRQEYAASTLARNKYKNNGSNERVLDYKPNEDGKFPEDVWTISIINPFAKERLDYPTQKPERLIEDIIKAASNPDLSCLIVSRIIREAKDGVPVILDAVNEHNEILYDFVIPKTFPALYEVKGTQKSEDVDMVLLREPKDAGYYEFSAKDELVVSKDSRVFTPAEIKKSFHADTYCFDSKPELECFKQYISSDKRFTLQECLPLTRETCQYINMIQNQSEYVNTIQTFWHLWKMEHISS